MWGGSEGVEEVLTDYRTNKVVVKGEKADPMKVMERVQRKSHRQVELLSPIPKPNPPPPPSPHEENKPQQHPNPPEKKQEPKVVTVVLKVHMHCEACSQEIKKRILRLKGVESVEPDLKGSQVSVKGVFEPAKLVEYVYKRTGKHVTIVKQEVEQEQEPEPPREEKKEGEAGKEEGGNKEEKKEGAEVEGGKKEKKVGEEAGGGKGKEKEKEKEKESGSGEEELVEVEMEMKRKENLYYPPYYMPRLVPVELYGSQPYKQQYHHQYQYQYHYPPYQYHYPPYQYPSAAAAYPPQMFSDDNPNACSVM